MKAPSSNPAPDLSQVKGLETAKRAMEIAMVGGLAVRLRGPSGHGKSMLREAMGAIAPVWVHEETLDAAGEPLGTRPRIGQFDIHVDVGPVSAADIFLPPPTEDSAAVGARVFEAKRRLGEQFRGEFGEYPLREVAATVWDQAPQGARQLMAQAVEAMRMSPEAFDRTCRVAACVAALAGAWPPDRIHYAEALSYRCEGRGL
jgi:predicted ATPase with chaperone activity